ncbi:SigE family RNA polymerase sigma factor [Micromonospora sp. NPDC048999]|uniref:SigE family RNA polymerase sigma factor n=1 Tax=Micromonospora sp. NPDC048999 TaxID=3155391 RepID=UPI0033EA370A
MDDFEVFVRQRSAALARTAYLLTGDRHLAEDLLQDTLARVAERWWAVVRGGDPEPYVRRMLYTRAIDGWRHRRRHAAATAAVAERPELQSPSDDAEIIARRLVLRDALARLTPRQRAVLVLRFYEDHTEVQTADLLGCSVNTVKSQTRHALSRLRAVAPHLAETFDRPSPVETP